MASNRRPDIPDQERLFYSPRQAAQALGIGPTLLRKRIHEGRLLATREGRLVLIARTEIERYARERAASTPASAPAPALVAVPRSRSRAQQVPST